MNAGRLITAVARLLRAMPRNPDAIEIDEALKELLASQSNKLDSGPAPGAALDSNARFDKKSYQRELMRKRRAKAKGRV